MNRRALAILALTLSLAACATRVPAPVAPTQAEWDAVSAGDYTCTREQSAPVDFAALTRTPERYYGQCIRLRALLIGGELVRDANSLKRPPGEIETVGIYPKDDHVLTLTSSTHPQFSEVSGRLRSCAERGRQLKALGERAQAAADANRKPTDPIKIYIPGFMAGYCHSEGGPAIWTDHIEFLPTAMD